MCALSVRPIVFLSLAAALSACQPQSPAMQAGAAAPRPADAVDARPAAYFGDLFSREESALSARSPELSAPTF